MDVYAKTTEAKDDLRSFVWDFGKWASDNDVTNILLLFHPGDTSVLSALFSIATRHSHMHEFTVYVMH